MQRDADIKQVASLNALAHHLSKHNEALTTQCLALCKVIMEKLAVLQRKKVRAEHICRELEMDYTAAFHNYAANASRSDNLHELQVALAKKEHQVRDARRYLSEINQCVSICIGAADAIVSATKRFSINSRNILEAGRSFVLKSGLDLEGYLDNAKPL